MTSPNISVFISYSHDSKEHLLWVTQLAEILERRPEFHVVFDQYDLHGGKDLTHFMERAVHSDRVIVVVTPNYVAKAEGRLGGVGYESSIISADILEDQLADKFVPALRRGNERPSFVKSKIFIDFRDDSNFDRACSQLVEALNRIPPRQRPTKQLVSSFSNSSPEGKTKENSSLFKRGGITVVAMALAALALVEIALIRRGELAKSDQTQVGDRTTPPSSSLVTEAPLTASSATTAVEKTTPPQTNSGAAVTSSVNVETPSLPPPSPVASPPLSRSDMTSESTAESKRLSHNMIAIATSLGVIRIELYPDRAPVSVRNFMKYVDDGFYVGTVFHRVIPHFMIQGGGFDRYLVQKETRPPIISEADNGLSNDRGTLAMARSALPASANSQFFINVVDNRFLNNGQALPDGLGYTVFGKVIEGMDVVDRIAAERTGSSHGLQDVPLEPIVIESIKSQRD